MTLYYLSTPYAKYPDGIEAAYEEAIKAASELLAQGYHVYSPIAHNHPISKNPKLHHYDWLKEDTVFMPKMDAMILYKMPSWEKSIGIGFEMGHFIAEDKPIFELSFPLPEKIELSELARFTNYGIENG